MRHHDTVDRNTEEPKLYPNIDAIYMYICISCFMWVYAFVCYLKGKKMERRKQAKRGGAHFTFSLFIQPKIDMKSG